MSMFQKMLNIVGELAGIQVNSSCSSSAAFLERHSEDFFERDRIVIENETRTDDLYLWIVKGCGSGTCLEHLAEECAEVKICSAHEKSKFYLLSFSDRDQGVIEEVTQDQALKLASKNKGLFPHQPVRQDIISGISNFSGIDEISLQEMSLFNEILSPVPNEPIYLKMHFDEKMDKVIVDMAKPVLKEYQTGKRKHGMFVFSAKHREISENLKGKDAFLKILPCENAKKAKFLSINENEFDVADKRSKNKTNQVQELAI